MVAAHSGALAGDDGAWEALFDAHGVTRVRDLDEMADTLELFAGGRRATPTTRAGGLATVHDSGAERALVVDVAHALHVPFASISTRTQARLAALLDPGLEATNPLDVWGTGADTEGLFRGCLEALSGDEEVAALALGVDLVRELDGDASYPRAVVAAHHATDKPVAVLANLGSAIDPVAADEVRRRGVPVLEGTRSGLLALRHLLALGRPRRHVPPARVDRARQARWSARLAQGPLEGPEAFALVADYGIPAVGVRPARSPREAVTAAEGLGYPVVLKTDEPGIAHKSDVGGVRLGVRDADSVSAAYDELAADLGPRVLVSATAPEGVELSLGIVRDPLLGPLVVVAAGGVLVEVLTDRVVALPPIDVARAHVIIGSLRCRPLLDGVRGGRRADLDAVAGAVAGLSQLATELGTRLAALEVNPLRCAPSGCVALDVLAEP